VRSLGLAARFVSGYIFVPDLDSPLAPTLDTPLDTKRDTTRGGGATHAWLQIYLPGAGWVDFDPTNSIIGNRHLIRVAVAWDHHQALPLWGTWNGEPGSFRSLDVEVSVTENR
jgi:transglutaminase-like putative cysteine protease